MYLMDKQDQENSSTAEQILEEIKQQENRKSKMINNIIEFLKEYRIKNTTNKNPKNKFICAVCNKEIKYNCLSYFQNNNWRKSICIDCDNKIEKLLK